MNINNFKYEKISVPYKNYIIQAYTFGEGDKVIFSLPSFPHSGLYYIWFASHYDLKKIKFVTLDLPGWIGYSDNVFKNTKFDVDVYLDIIKHVLSELKVNEFSLIGYSFGGSIALRLAGEKNLNIKKIALVSTIFDSSILKRNATTIQVDLLHKLKLYFFLSSHIKRKFKSVARELTEKEGFPENFFTLYNDMIGHMVPPVLTEAVYQLMHTDSSKYLENLKGKPLLVVNSRDEDEYFRKQAEFLRRYFDREKSIYLKGSHDDFIVNSKSDVVKKVIDFLIK